MQRRCAMTHRSARDGGARRVNTSSRRGDPRQGRRKGGVHATLESVSDIHPQMIRRAVRRARSPRERGSPLLITAGFGRARADQYVDGTCAARHPLGHVRSRRRLLFFCVSCADSMASADRCTDENCNGVAVVKTICDDRRGGAASRWSGSGTTTGLANLPMFVPPGHCVCSCIGLTIAPRVSAQSVEGHTNYSVTGGRWPA